MYWLHQYAVFLSPVTNKAAIREWGDAACLVADLYRSKLAETQGHPFAQHARMGIYIAMQMMERN